MAALSSAGSPELDGASGACALDDNGEVRCGVTRSPHHAKWGGDGRVDGLDLEWFDARNVGTRWAPPEGGDKNLLCLPWALDRNFHGAVGGITHPTGQPQTNRSLPYVPAKPHTLNTPTNAEVERRHASKLALYSQQCRQGCRDPGGERSVVVADGYVSRDHDLTSPDACGHRLERVCDRP